MNEDESELIGITAAAALAGVSPDLLRRRIHAGELAGFDDGRDKRRLLVRRSELAAMTRIRPTQRRRTPETTTKAASAA